jgi:D-alanyl-D-alanine carboxypeptidase
VRPRKEGEAGPDRLRSSAAPTPQRIDAGELQRLLDDLVAAGAPGAAARVENEAGVLKAASGVADLRTGRPMRPELHFRAGSVTKSFLATLVLQLVADGRVELSDSLERCLPGILPYGDQVTVRHLLNHTGGVPDDMAILYRTLYGSRQGRSRAWTPRELVSLMDDQPQDFPPGRAWSYSNTGYVLLGLIVESTTGKTLARELGRRILQPLRLAGTSFPGKSTGIPSPGSRGYSPPLGPELEVMDGPLVDFTVQNPSYAGAAGALVSTLDDLTRFFRALLGGRILPPGLLAEMVTTVPVPPASIPLPLFDRCGMGLIVTETPAGPLVGQLGGIPGFLNFVLSTPDGRRQVGLMVNVGALPPDRAVEAFIQTFRRVGTRLST